MSEVFDRYTSRFDYIRWKLHLDGHLINDVSWIQSCIYEDVLALLVALDYFFLRRVYIVENLTDITCCAIPTRCHEDDETSFGIDALTLQFLALFYSLKITERQVSNLAIVEIESMS